MPRRAAPREDTNFALRPRSVPSGFSRGQARPTRQPPHGFAPPQVGPLDRERLAARRRVERSSAPTTFSNVHIVEVAREIGSRASPSTCEFQRMKKTRRGLTVHGDTGDPMLSERSAAAAFY
jgi:hypothetical protein